MATIHSPFGNIPYPDGDESYDIPAKFSDLVAAMDPKLVGTAGSTSDRDSLFFNAPAGFLATVVNPPTHPTAPNQLVGLYIKTGVAGVVTWSAIYEPATSMAEQPLQLVDGYSPRDTTYVPTVFRENANFMVLNGGVVKSDASVITNSSVVAYIPSGFVPFRREDYPCAAYFGGAGSYKITIYVDGSIQYWGPDVYWVGFAGTRVRTA